MSSGVAAPFGVRRVREHFADGVESLQIGGRIGARCAPDGRLIHDDGFLDLRIAFQAIAKFLDAAPISPRRQRTVENIVDQRGFPGAAHAGNDRERPERNHQVHILQIVEIRAKQLEKFSGRFVTAVRHGNPQLTA